MPVSSSNLQNVPNVALSFGSFYFRIRMANNHLEETNFSSGVFDDKGHNSEVNCPVLKRVCISIIGVLFRFWMESKIETRER